MRASFVARAPRPSDSLDQFPHPLRAPTWPAHSTLPLNLQSQPQPSIPCRFYVGFGRFYVGYPSVLCRFYVGFMSVLCRFFLKNLRRLPPSNLYPLNRPPLMSIVANTTPAQTSFFPPLAQIPLVYFKSRIGL